jgi:glucan-binding YG repeat protein
MEMGLVEWDGSKFYLNSAGESGRMLTGWQKADGNWYYFRGGDSGRSLVSWQEIGGNWYYFDPATSEMKTGLLEWDNGYFYLRDGDDGRMYSGWMEFDEGQRYFTPAPSGRAARGIYVIDGISFAFDATTALLINGQTNIMGTSNLTVNQMVNWFNGKNHPYPTQLAQGGAADIQQFATIVFEESRAEGVRPEVVFAQIAHETGWLQFGGAVKVEQYNFGGLGAIDSNPSGNSASFKDVRTGIRAQVQHLKAYATAANVSLANQNVDPRFHLVKRGCAPFVEWLGQKENPNGYGWATSPGYGQRLVSLITELKGASRLGPQSLDETIGLLLDGNITETPGDEASENLLPQTGATEVVNADDVDDSKVDDSSEASETDGESESDRTSGKDDEIGDGTAADGGELPDASDTGGLLEDALGNDASGPIDTEAPLVVDEAAELDKPFEGLAPLAEKAGWYQEEGNWYYYKDGVRVTDSWQKDTVTWCYLGFDGRAAIGWTTIHGKQYDFDTLARVARGWVHIENKWYFFEQQGDHPTTSNLGQKLKEQTASPTVVSPLAGYSAPASENN